MPLMQRAVRCVPAGVFHYHATAGQDLPCKDLAAAYSPCLVMHNLVYCFEDVQPRLQAARGGGTRMDGLSQPVRPGP